MITKIFGPPGTGKTHALLGIVEQAISSGTPVERIAYITFTVRAQREAVTRAARLLGKAVKELPYFRTLHSIAYRQLQVGRTRLIVNTKHLAPLANALHLEFVNASPFDAPPERVSENDGDAFLAFDHFRRHTGMTIEKAWQRWALESDATIFRVKQFVKEYARWKDAEGLVDFTDLLEAKLAPLPVDLLIVDEAQDLSALQWKALYALAAEAKQVYIAGDDDQAIYTWAGASATEFLLAPCDESRVLSQSYRVPRRVQQIAWDVISPVRKRQSKSWAARESEGRIRWSPDTDSAMAELSQSGKDTLVLYRNHVFGKVVEEQLQMLGAPYSYADPERVPAARAWIPAVTAWQRLQKPELTVTRDQAIQIAEAIAIGRGIDEQARRKLADAHSSSTWSLDQLRMIGISSQGPWFTSLTRVNPSDIQYLRAILLHHGNDGLLKSPRIRISSIHAAKGAQADHVVLLTDMTRRVAKGIDHSPDDERRVWYVGVTRAKEALTIVGLDHPFIQA